MFMSISNNLGIYLGIYPTISTIWESDSLEELEEYPKDGKA